MLNKINGINSSKNKAIIDKMNNIKKMIPFFLFFLIITAMLAPENIDIKAIIAIMASNTIKNTCAKDFIIASRIALKILPIMLSAMD